MKKFSLLLIVSSFLVLGVSVSSADSVKCQVTPVDSAIESVLFNEADYPWRTNYITDDPPGGCICGLCCIDYLCWQQIREYPSPLYKLALCSGVDL